MNMETYRRKDLLSIRELEPGEISFLLDQTDSFREINERDIKKVPTLRGKTIVNLFFENSTRTRASFEIAGKRLSADVINLSVSTSSAAKGETLRDTARNIEAMATDVLVVRHWASGAPAYLGQGTRLRRRERGRRLPRAPHPGAARPLHHQGAQEEVQGPERLDRGGHRAQPGGALERGRPPEAGRERHLLRPLDDAARGSRLPGRARDDEAR